MQEALKLALVIFKETMRRRFPTNVRSQSEPGSSMLSSQSNSLKTLALHGSSTMLHDTTQTSEITIRNQRML